MAVDEHSTEQEAKIEEKVEQIERSNNPFGIGGHKKKRAGIKQREFLIADWIEEKKIAMLYGESGSLKSFTTLDMALCITYGVKWHGKETKQGDVLYLMGEGNDTVDWRIRAWEQEMSKILKQENKHLDQNRELFYNRMYYRFDTDGYEKLRSSLDNADIKPSLIIIDTVNRFMIGDENYTQDMSNFIHILDRLRDTYNAAILIVHHVGKDKRRGPRGSNALEAAVDVKFEQTVTRVKNNDSGYYNVRIVQEKNKDGHLEHITLKAYVVKLDDTENNFKKPEHSISYYCPDTKLAKEEQLYYANER